MIKLKHFLNVFKLTLVLRTIKKYIINKKQRKKYFRHFLIPPPVYLRALTIFRLDLTVKSAKSCVHVYTCINYNVTNCNTHKRGVTSLLQMLHLLSGGGPVCTPPRKMFLKPPSHPERGFSS